MAPERRFDRRRRALLRALAGTPLLGMRPGWLAAGSAGPPPSRRSAPGPSVVARVRREKLLVEGGGLEPARLDEVLGGALCRAVGEETPVAVMRSLFRPTDVVGLKLNCLAGRGLSPHPHLVQRLTEWLRAAGVPAGNIVVWDRGDRELTGAGVTPGRWPSGVRCAGTNSDYDWTPREWGPGGSCFARALVEDFTALINVGVLKDHDLAGVSLGLKNWYGAIHNPNKHHDDGCAPFIPHLAAYPLIRDRLRLTVVDGTTGQCHGGPARNPRWTWPWGGVLASTDPVAIDAVGWGIIEERRRAQNLPPLAQEEREPRWIAGSASLGLGRADAAGIEVVDL